MRKEGVAFAMFLTLFIASILRIPPDLHGVQTPRVEAKEINVVAMGEVSATSTPELVVDDSLPICNCYLEVKKYIPDLPRTKELTPNSPARPGAVAIYNYNGTPHYALVLDVYHDGTYRHLERGSNLKRCEFYERVVDEENPYLVGYWYRPQ